MDNNAKSSKERNAVDVKDNSFFKNMFGKMLYNIIAYVRKHVTAVLIFTLFRKNFSFAEECMPVSSVNKSNKK